MDTKARSVLYCLSLLVCLVSYVHSHGRVLIPPSRASAWRLGFSSPVDYNDNEGYCGGFQAQWSKNGGKCGICGDAWDQPAPRNHERPDGKFVIKSKDFILSRFREGDSIAVNLEITAAHRGYFEFHLCKVDDLPGQVDATVECLEKTVLRLAGTTETRVAAPVSGAQAYALNVTLPAGVTCNHCVLQWKYRAGNNWGYDSEGSGLGHGPQEHFFSCSDIQISARDGSLPATPKPTIPTTPTTAAPTTPQAPITTAPPITTPGVDPCPLSKSAQEFYRCNYCAEQCFKYHNCDAMVCGYPLRACARGLRIPPAAVCPVGY